MMKLKTLFSTFFVAVTIPAALACEGPPVCTVIDPTGTPLNVRTGPNEEIVGTLRKGVKVEVIEHQEHEGKRWALVAHYGAGWGYVFGDYLDCSGEDELGPVCTVKDPTGTPLNVRENPNGTILGTWDNGVRVRPYEEVTHNGKLWYAVERFADDNAVGWVFDPYLGCEEDVH
jgi:uncharacterized protein YgiM (DUF1202 family)